MHVSRVRIENFRGIKRADILLPKHGVLIGDNNTGKTTILEALDLVLGPERLSRQPPIDEHDFFRGEYAAEPPGPQPGGAAQGETDAGLDQAAAVPGDGEGAAVPAPSIDIEVTIADLTDEQKAKFGDYVEFWDSGSGSLYDQPDPAGVDRAQITEALRVTFRGWYNPEEDDFEAKTYFSRSLTEGDQPSHFTKKDKLACGFLYLRSLRTGSRALSLERGSLLDIILRLKEIRPQMWEETLTTLSSVQVASNPELGISPVLRSIDAALKKFVPTEWGIEPRLMVSNLTREHLRKVITAFIGTGDADNHSAPFYRQGTGTINMLVLAMLSQIAAGKQNVVFAMEEPETAVPPYAQKCIVREVRSLASQALFTSHSPYVLEEFSIDETVVLGRDSDGLLTRRPITLPDNLRLKRYRQEFRTRFCEGLLSRRVLIAEGAAEASAFPVVCRRLAELEPCRYSTLEALGICTVDAGGEGSIPGIAQLYRDLGKHAFALCDHQDAERRALIETQVELLLMHDESGIEELVIKGTTKAALERFARSVDWPPHLKTQYPDPAAQAPDALSAYFSWSKGTGGIADFLAQCTETEIPEWLRSACLALKSACTPTGAATTAQIASPDSSTGQGADADATD